MLGRASICILLGLIGGPVLAQNFTSEEAALSNLCKGGDPDACVDLRESLTRRIQRGERVNLNAQEMITDECNAGVPGACFRRDLMERMANERDNPQPEPVPTTPTPTPAPEATISTPAANPPAEDAPDGMPWWAFVLIGVAVGGIGSHFLIGRSLNDDKEPPIQPALPLPAIREGERTEQGDLLPPQTDTQMVVPWDRSFIHRWLDKKIKETRAKVTDQTFLDLCDSLAPGNYAETYSRTAAGEYLQQNDQGLMNQSVWASPEWTLLCLMRARHGHAGGAYALATDLWQNEDSEEDRAILHLLRLDADKDFNPSGVNMHAYHQEKKIYYRKDLITEPEMEAYLRHLFRIGAPDGYLHITLQLLDFYARFTKRPDHGYVAAAYRRIERYFPHELSEWKAYFERNPEMRDLTDTSVDFEGVMQLQFQKEGGPVQ